MVKGCPKGPKRNPRSPQGEKREIRRHAKETNESENFIHIIEIYANSRYTAVQRPASKYESMQMTFVYVLVSPSHTYS